MRCEYLSGIALSCCSLCEKGVLSFWYSLPMARPHFGPIDLPPPPLLDDHGSFLEVEPGTLPLTDSRNS